MTVFCGVCVVLLCLVMRLLWFVAWCLVVVYVLCFVMLVLLFCLGFYVVWVLCGVCVVVYLLCGVDVGVGVIVVSCGDMLWCVVQAFCGVIYRLVDLFRVCNRYVILVGFGYVFAV